jgi:hypothetical protein
MTQPSTASEALRLAYQAILRGDYAERDRILERATRLIEAEEKGNAVQRVLAVDFYVKANGVAIPTPLLARAAGEIH